MGFCFYTGKHSKIIETIKLGRLELNLYNIFSGLATIYLTIFIWVVVPLRWLTFNLSLEALFIFFCGFLLLDRILRIYSLLILAIIAFRLSFIDNYHALNETVKWLILSIELIIFNTMYLVYRNLKDRSLILNYEKHLVKIVFIISTYLFTVAMYRYIPSSWISLALGLEGVILLVAGFILKDKIFRSGGLIIFALTVLRVVFVDLSMLDIVYKIISFIILGILFLSISFIYTKYNIDKSK